MEIIAFLTEQWLLVSVLIVLVYLYILREKMQSGKALSVHGVTQLLNKDQALLLDVRDETEFKEGHIVDSINIPHASITARLSELDSHKDKVIIVADKYGQHSGHVGRQLRQAGFDAYRLGGGMTEWKNQNLPVVRS